MTREYTVKGSVLRYVNSDGKVRFVAYNDLGRELCVSEREKTAWDAIEQSWRR